MANDNSVFVLFGLNQYLLRRSTAGLPRCREEDVYVKPTTDTMTSSLALRSKRRPILLPTTTNRKRRCSPEGPWPQCFHRQDGAFLPVCIVCVVVAQLRRSCQDASVEIPESFTLILITLPRCMHRYLAPAVSFLFFFSIFTPTPFGPAQLPPICVAAGS